MAKIIDATYTQSNLEYFIDQVILTHEPIFISGNNNNTAVLISEEMWEDFQDCLDTMIADQRIDNIKSGKSEVYTLEEVMNKLNLNRE